MIVANWAKPSRKSSTRHEKWEQGEEGHFNAVKMPANTFVHHYSNIICTDGKPLAKQEGVKAS